MKKIFPEMTERVSSGHVFAIFVFWVLCFVLLPFILPTVIYGLENDIELQSWVEGIYHVVNGIAMISLLRNHISDSTFRMRKNLKNFIAVIGITLGLMLMVRYAEATLIPMIYPNIISIYDVYPMSEFEVLITAGYMVSSNPIFGTLCVTIFAPVAITGFFYASGFAPVCCKRPWLAYIMVSVLLLLVTGFDIFWRGLYYGVFSTYLLRLPIHLLACWSYQKTNNIWAPIISLALFNLITSIFDILYAFFVF